MLEKVSCSEQLNLRMAEAAVPEGPHQVLTLEQLGGEKQRIRTVSAVDERALSGIMIGTSSNRNIGKESLPVTLGHLRSSGNLGGLRFLNIESWLDEGTLDWLIKEVNKGGFEGLEDLRLFVDWERGSGLYRCKNIVIPGALTGLQKLKVFVSLGAPGPFRTQHLPVALQSFASASVAPKLASVDSNVYLDLSGQEVKKLTIHEFSCNLLSGDEATRMVESVKGSLTDLAVIGDFRTLQLPKLPNLSMLLKQPDVVLRSGWVTNPMDLNPFPGLSKLILPFACVPWSELEKLLAPKGNLKDLSVPGVPIPEDYDLPPALVLEPFTILLNSGLARLVLDFNRKVKISEVLNLIQLVPLEERKRKRGRGKWRKERKSAVLEIYDVWGKADPVGDFSSILEMLGERWGSVRFVNFKFHDAGRPTWKEMETEVLVSGAQKKGMIRITDNVGKPGLTVSIEMKE